MDTLRKMFFDRNFLNDSTAIFPQKSKRFVELDEKIYKEVGWIQPLATSYCSQFSDLQAIQPVIK